MNVLVVGGAGYIGSHTCKSLALAGHNPVVFDNLSQGHEWAVKWGPWVLGDISNTILLEQVIDRFEIEAVMHFAAHAYVGESMLNPSKYFANNCSNSLALLQVVISKKIKWFIFSSTCATYGNPVSLPIDEQHPQNPINPYGESKLVVERYLKWFGAIEGLKWVALRYFNAAGADMETEIGELHDPETHLIPLVIESAVCRQHPVFLFGSDYNTPDGTPLRDYVHVADLANAHVLSLEFLINGGESQALNLGTGVGHSLIQIVDTVRTVTASSPITKHLPRRAGDAPIMVADASKARRLLKWRPLHSDIQTIVASSFRWRLQRDREIAKSEKSLAYL